LGKKNLNRILIPQPPLHVQQRIVSLLDKFHTLTTSISEGLPRELELRKQQYERYRDQLLSPEMFVTRSPRSYNSQIGVPLSVWLMDEHTQVGVFEAGISKPGEMAALRAIIRPTIAVLTNLGTAHQENFSSMEAKCREKLVLFHDARTVVYDADDAIVRQIVSETDIQG